MIEVVKLAIAVGGMLTVAILYFILQRAANARGDRADARAVLLSASLDDAKEQLARAHDAERILHDNIDEHLREISDLASSNHALEGKLASAKKAYDDLARLLEDHPGALPVALHNSLERLRQEVSPAQGAASAAAGGGADGGSSGPVHGPDDLEAP